MLKTSHKLLILQTALVIPIVLLTYLLVAEKNLVIDFNDQQINGMTYLQTVRGILQYVAEHRGMNNAYLNGDSTMRSKIEAKQQQIDNTIKEVDIVDAQHNSLLLSTSQWNTIKTQWQNLKNQLANFDAPTSFSQHTALLKEILKLIEHVGYNSNLMLNSYRDNHYLAKIVVIDLPVLIEYLGQLRGMASGVAAHGAMTGNRKIELLGLSNRIAPMLVNLNYSIENILTYQPSFQPLMQIPTQDLISKGKAFVDFTEQQIIWTERITVSASTLFDQGTQAIASGLKSYDVAVAALSKLLEQRANDARFSRNLVLGLVLLGVTLALLLVLRISHSIVKLLGGEPAEMVAMAEHIAQGNLSATSPDQQSAVGLYAALLAMNTQLAHIVRPARQTSELVNAAAKEIAQGNADLAQRTEEQAAALEETAASLEQLTSAVASNADNARQANELASAARRQAEQSGEVVEQTVAAMAAIHRSSRTIADIIGVIDEIAFQTNLLALNASVEAARAGDQGLGFAVVASEVRKLAQRSADAAKEIKNLISGSVAEVEEGNRQVEKSGQTLREIVKAVQEVSDIIASMALTAHEQAGGLDQVSKAILQMDQVTQQNAALVEETAAASQAMGEQAHELQQLMAVFKLHDSSDEVNMAGISHNRSSTDFFKWNDSLSVGDVEIDRQHQKLINMINNLHEAIASDCAEGQLGKLLERLIAHTQDHFSDEEVQMQACDYPHLTDHTAVHAEFIENIQQFYKKFKQGKKKISIGLIRFLRNWFAHHIQNSDRHYGSYLSNR